MARAHNAQSPPSTHQRATGGFFHRGGWGEGGGWLPSLWPAAPRTTTAQTRQQQDSQHAQTQGQSTRRAPCLPRCTKADSLVCVVSSGAVFAHACIAGSRPAHHSCLLFWEGLGACLSVDARRHWPPQSARPPDRSTTTTPVGCGGRWWCPPLSFSLSFFHPFIIMPPPKFIHLFHGHAKGKLAKQPPIPTPPHHHHHHRHKERRDHVGLRRANAPGRGTDVGPRRPHQ